MHQCKWTDLFLRRSTLKSKLKNNLKGESQEKSEGPTDKRSNGLKSISQRDNPLDEIKVLSDGKASVYRLSPLNLNLKLENKEQFCHASKWAVGIDYQRYMRKWWSFYLMNQWFVARCQVAGIEPVIDLDVIKLPLTTLFNCSIQTIASLIVQWAYLVLYM